MVSTKHLHPNKKETLQQKKLTQGQRKACHSARTMQPELRKGKRREKEKNTGKEKMNIYKVINKRQT